MFKNTSCQSNKILLHTNSSKSKQQFRTFTQKQIPSLLISSQTLSLKSFQPPQKSLLNLPTNLSKNNKKPSPLKKQKHKKLTNSRNSSCKEQNSVKLSDLISSIKQQTFTIRNKNRCSEPSINSVSDSTQPKSSADTSATTKRVYDNKKKFKGISLSLKSLGRSKNENIIKSLRCASTKSNYNSKKNSIEISSIISEESVFSSKTNSYTKKQSSKKKTKSNIYNNTIENTIDGIKKKLWKNIEEKRKRDLNIKQYCNLKCTKHKEEFLDISLTYSEDSLTRRIIERKEHEKENINSNNINKKDEYDFKVFCDMMQRRLFGKD